jgi:hypothetical protein
MSRSVKSCAWTLLPTLDNVYSQQQRGICNLIPEHYLAHRLLVLCSGLWTSLRGFWPRGLPSIHKSRRVLEIKSWRILSTWWSGATEHSKNLALCSRLHDSTRPRLWDRVVEINFILPLNFQYWTRDPYTNFSSRPPKPRRVLTDWWNDVKWHECRKVIRGSNRPRFIAHSTVSYYFSQREEFKRNPFPCMPWHINMYFCITWMNTREELFCGEHDKMLVDSSWGGVRKGKSKFFCQVSLAESTSPNSARLQNHESGGSASGWGCFTTKMLNIWLSSPSQSNKND